MDSEFPCVRYHSSNLVSYFYSILTARSRTCTGLICLVLNLTLTRTIVVLQLLLCAILDEIIHYQCLSIPFLWIIIYEKWLASVPHCFDKSRGCNYQPREIAFSGTGASSHGPFVLDIGEFHKLSARCNQWCKVHEQLVSKKFVLPHVLLYMNLTSPPRSFTIIIASNFRG